MIFRILLVDLEKIIYSFTFYKEIEEIFEYGLELISLEKDKPIDYLFAILQVTKNLHSELKEQVLYRSLKSGFWQVKMHPDSIEWTAFTSPEGHFELLVMPFGLKNAPSIFQRKMDSIFSKHNKFIIVYIDDILVFSKNKREHRGHLQILFSEFIRHGLIINKKKMFLFKEYIEFLGVNIGKGKIELQPHIAQKALDFPDKLEDLKQLQKFLGLVNYARPYSCTP